jgi:tetratricopeptide (TPR) repeat protein
MLSCIENGTSNPSLETLQYIADRLSVPTEFLIAEDDNLAFYQKKALISKIYRAYNAKNYTACVALIESITETDDELNFLLADSYLELGKQNVSRGSLLKARDFLERSEEYRKKTRIKAHHLEAQTAMYISIAKNIQSPLLEFDALKYITALSDSVDFEFFKYLTIDSSYAFETPTFSLHMEAKVLIKERNYLEATKRLLNAVELSKNESYNAFVVFSLYSDLEYCYKQLYNYEKAYLYSSKRMTLLESFKN